MSRFAGVAALAAGLTMTMIPMVAGGAPAPDDSSREQATTVDQPRDKKCVTRQEYRRLDVTGKKASTPRKARRIVGNNGERESLSRAAGSRWEIRKYLRCNSQIMHVYVNYRDKRAYRKAW